MDFVKSTVPALVLGTMSSREDVGAGGSEPRAGQAARAPRALDGGSAHGAEPRVTGVDRGSRAHSGQPMGGAPGPKGGAR